MIKNPDTEADRLSAHASDQPYPIRPVPLDPECAKAFGLALETLIPAMSIEMIPMVRELIAKNEPPESDEAIIGVNNDFRVEERIVPGPQGAPDIAIVICIPTRATGPVPVIYVTHGGGMFCGNRRTGLEMFLEPARDLDIAVVSVEYRLAPEHPDPAPIEDCYAGLVWIVENSAEFGIDPSRVIIAGGSAGGGLAAGLGLLTRDRGGPAVLGQMLIIPMLDDRTNTVLALQNDISALSISDGAAYGTSHDLTSSRSCWRAYLGEREDASEVSPYASPARATDLSRLPKTFVEIGSAESFRDECVTYATRIWQAGGEAELHVWPGGFHGYFYYQPKAAISQDTVSARLRWLRRVLSASDH